MRFNRTIIVFLLLISLTGCAGHEGLHAGMHRSITTPASPIIERVMVAAEALPPEPPPASLDYQVGIGDSINVTVYGRVDLSTSIGGKGSRVDGNGNIQLPLIGSVSVAGLTTTAIRDRVETFLRRFMQSPSVVVEVIEYRGKPLYLMGQFRNPGVHYMDRPMTIMQGIALGNGFDANANLRGVRLLRNKQIAPLDIYALIMEGRIEQNSWLRPGDTIFIPDIRSQNVFVFGSVTKPGIIAMNNGRMNLLEAIAIADPKSVGKDIKNVRIIRSLTTTSGELLVVDVEQIRRGETLPMQLMEGDVIYVPRSAFGTWNDVVNEILPSLQALSSFMQPFINIKYLSQ